MDNYPNSVRPHYPRVTTILDETMSQEGKAKLLKWEHTLNAKLGDGAAQEHSKNAREMGTIFHAAIEGYLNKGIEPTFIETIQETRWNYALPHLKMIKNKYFCLEAEVYSDKLQYIGHSDCLAWEGDKVAILDWKTTGKFKKKEWIADYFIQGAAYAIAAYECGVAPTLPHEIQIYIFGPKRTQLFIEPFNADLASQWLKRLKAYQANQPVVV